MASNHKASYPVRSGNREVALNHAILTGTGASPPAVTTDDAGVISSVSRTAEGDYTLTLKEQWRSGYATCHDQSADDKYAKCSAPTLGAATNTVDIILREGSGGTAAELALGETLVVEFRLSK